MAENNIPREEKPKESKKRRFYRRKNNNAKKDAANDPLDASTDTVASVETKSMKMTRESKYSKPPKSIYIPKIDIQQSFHARLAIPYSIYRALKAGDKVQKEIAGDVPNAIVNIQRT
ncbi:hypothetical protein O9G_001446 [Rozella allomycis CSF55]|uniref:Uncharacterized protein n=1 Tax=Rozella allomycis (strain CSF55) TaxID=988480 RepID=A0A075B5D5_ROZAC|nr:hypothetical protein O9G_001446 [Rozella allomycis CSF55]|eukprot:EPZ37001.1 hypothetical protein O9G_001446 [Rozella allomycis CSF55]